VDNALRQMAFDWGHVEVGVNPNPNHGRPDVVVDLSCTASAMRPIEVESAHVARGTGLINKQVQRLLLIYTSCRVS